MNEPQIFSTDIRRTCFVYDTNISRIFDWIKKTVAVDTMLPYLLPKTWDEMYPKGHSDFKYFGETINDEIRSHVVLNKFTSEGNKIVANGMIEITNNSFSGKYHGKGVVLLVECIPLFGDPSKKVQIDFYCAGDDINNTLVNFFNELWSRFLVAFDALDPDHGNRLPREGVPPLQGVEDISHTRQEIEESQNKLQETDFKPWEHIPDRGDDRRIIESWCEGKTAKEIGQIFAKQPETVLNTISKLRKEFPDAKIPKGKEKNSYVYKIEK